MLNTIATLALFLIAQTDQPDLQPSTQRTDAPAEFSEAAPVLLHYIDTHYYDHWGRLWIRRTWYNRCGQIVRVEYL